jgi:hypothetical protein
MLQKAVPTHHLTEGSSHTTCNRRQSPQYVLQKAVPTQHVTEGSSHTCYRRQFPHNVLQKAVPTHVTEGSSHTTCYRRQFPHMLQKAVPTQHAPTQLTFLLPTANGMLTFLLPTAHGMFTPPSDLCNTSSFLTRLVQLMFAIPNQQISKLYNVLFMAYFPKHQISSHTQSRPCSKRSTFLVSSLNLCPICHSLQ